MESTIWSEGKLVGMFVPFEMTNDKKNWGLVFENASTQSYILFPIFMASGPTGKNAQVSDIISFDANILFNMDNPFYESDWGKFCEQWYEWNYKCANEWSRFITLLYLQR